MVSVNKKSNVINALKPIFFSVLSIFVSFIIAVFFVMWSREDGFIESSKLLMTSFWNGSFGNLFSLSETMVYATIYMFTGLAHLIAFRTNLFNIGVEGQFTVGMLASVIVGMIPGIPMGIHLILVFLSGMAAGALWAFIPAILKVKLNSNEVVNTIMMNFIGIHLLNLCISLFLKEPGSETTYSIAKSAILPTIINDGGIRMNYGLVLGIILVVIVHFYINKTRSGYELRSVGYNQSASEYGGINIKKSIILAMVISGIIAGLGGAVFVSGVQHRVPKLHNFLNYGFDGIAVALLARNNPIAVIVSSILFGALNAASLELQFNGIPKDIVFLVQAIIILFIAGEYLFKLLINKFKKGGAK